MSPDWKHLLAVCCEHARMKSPDPSTQNGAILLDSWRPLNYTLAVNEFPRGVEYREERWERPAKYGFIEHAERNAIYAAARIGIQTDGLTLVCPWAACDDCGRAIIQAGISRLVTLRPKTSDTNERWDSSIARAMTMLEEAGVEVLFIDGPLDCHPLLRNGELYQP